MIFKKTQIYRTFFFFDNFTQKGSPEVPSVLSVHSSFISQAQLSLISSIVLSYPIHSSFISEAQLLHILCTGYKRGVWDKKELCWGKTSGLPEEYMYGKSECMKIIIGCNHFYGGYCFKRDFKGILRYFKVF